MSADVFQLVAVFVVGGMIGAHITQAIYGKLLANYQGYCAEYRAMLDEARATQPSPKPSRSP